VRQYLQHVSTVCTTAAVQLQILLSGFFHHSSRGKCCQWKIHGAPKNCHYGMWHLRNALHRWSWHNIMILNWNNTHMYSDKKVLTSNETRCSQRRQTSPSVPPPDELDGTYALSLILAHLHYYVKTWRHPQNQKYIHWHQKRKEQQTQVSYFFTLLQAEVQPTSGPQRWDHAMVQYASTGRGGKLVGVC